jgi:hypothetical protein
MTEIGPWLASLHMDGGQTFTLPRRSPHPQPIVCHVGSKQCGHW